ncbi:arginase family protein [Histomonas meleagridis]|uniref:arginase family protein n=1 Tax=Histomonas meleagridis TaxID=135588 RepID=UPI00355A061C|nr:arginase family protein [Histomonas meleagridis]KAH0798688.1 arginase family protein [Histomonas meleagridis]
MKTLRLKYKQWQGAYGPDMAKYSEKYLTFMEATHGYFQGNDIISLLAPPPTGPVAEVPVPYTETEEDMATVDGIYARGACFRQLKQALQILDEKQPAKVCVIGGDCAVSTPVFSWLSNKYKDECAIIWYDAHPDITCPNEGYAGFHAMALGHVLGIGDKQFLDTLPGRVPPSRALLVGLRSLWGAEKRKEELGLKSLSPDEFRSNPSAVYDWLRSTGAKKVLVHFDVDVLDPEECRMTNCTEPNGLKIAEVVESIRGIESVCEIVCLTLAEHIPIVEIQLQRMLNALPLFK